MFKESNEHGISKGLGIFDGSCSQFEKVSIKVPHVGFNFINHDRHKIWKDPNQASFYFVHSYKIDKVTKKTHQLFTVNIESIYCIYKKKKHIWISVSSRKSGKQGIQLMKNF